VPTPYPEPPRSSPYSHIPLPEDPPWYYPSIYAWVFPLGFPTKTLNTPLFSPKHVTCPAHLVLLDLITRTILGQQNRSLSSSLCSFLISPVPSFLSSPNTLLNTLFSITLGVCYSLSVSDQVLHLYKTKGKIIVPYILFFKFLDSKLEDKDSALNESKHSLTLNLPLISYWIAFWSIMVVTK